MNPFRRPGEGPESGSTRQSTFTGIHPDCPDLSVTVPKMCPRTPNVEHSKRRLARSGLDAGVLRTPWTNRPGFGGGSDVTRVRRCPHTWFQATGWADWWRNSNYIGSAHAEAGVPSLAVVEDFEAIEYRLANSIRVRHRLRLSSSVCILPQKDSIIASQQSPTDPMEGTAPISARRSP